MAWRDSRASRRRLLLFSASIVFGVAALVSIGSFGENLREAVEEQTHLEELITRYRSLVPSIETTLTKSDVWSRAYTFKRQSEEVYILHCTPHDHLLKYRLNLNCFQLCKFLKKLEPIAQACESAENPGVIANLKDRSKVFANEVDHRREELITSLQRGRDLLKDPLAPSFVREDLANLENSWSNAQETMLVVSEKLKSKC